MVGSGPVRGLTDHQIFFWKTGVAAGCAEPAQIRTIFQATKRSECDERLHSHSSRERDVA
jgi:hypothetical protein